MKLPAAGLLIAALSAAGCVSSSEIESIQSQLDDIQVQVLQLRKQGPTLEQLSRVETNLEARLQHLVELQADVQGDLGKLSEQVEQLQTKLEDTNFRLARLAQDIDATNRELRAVRDAAEEAREARRRRPRSPSASSEQDDEGQQDGSDAQSASQLYDTAYDHFLAGNHPLAIQGFQRYLDRHPDTEQSDNAAYWLGECYYRQNQFQRAIEQYDTVLDRYPQSDRIASALVRKGYAYLELGQRAQGIVQLQTVVCDHPGTDEAHVARQRLAELGIDVNC